jgi:hypothetical protein
MRVTRSWAFLLALRAEGYHPQVIVTNLRQDYGPVIARVFPQAAHHETRTSVASSRSPMRSVLSPSSRNSTASPPFSLDAQRTVRGKCPLQLAGYDISHLPRATLCAGLSILSVADAHCAVRVPNP